MQKSKFLSLLKKLSTHELESFHKYLKRYHPREKIALQVFEYLIKFYPDFGQEERLQAEKVFQKVFKKEVEMDKRAKKNMKNTASALGNWLKDFLILSKTKQNQQLQQTIWLSILQERGMKDEFSRKAEAFYLQTRKNPFNTPADALPNFMASYFYRESLSSDKPLIHAKIIQQCTETMTDCWEVMRLKMASEMSLVRSVTDQVPIHKIIEATDFQQIGLSILKDTYEALWQLTASGEEVHFARLESLLVQHAQHIDPKELEGIIRYVYNFTADQSRHTQEAIHAERMHRLNKIGLEFGVFSQDGYLPSSAFSNIVTVACQAKDYVWASEFIQDYGRILPENQRETAVLLARAVLAFETSKFKEVLNLLEPVGFSALFDVLRSKSLLIRSYYELRSDQETIEDTCAQLESLLRRSPKIKAVKATLAFVLIIKMLAAQKSSKKVILDRIEKANSLYFKAWLLGKTTHYKARHAERNLKA